MIETHNETMSPNQITIAAINDWWAKDNPPAINRERRRMKARRPSSTSNPHSVDNTFTLFHSFRV